MTRELRNGQAVRVNATVTDCESGENLRGLRGEVLGVNPHARSPIDGKPCVNVRGEDGHVRLIPQQALDTRN